MKVHLLCIGKTHSVDIQNLIDDYKKRLPAYIGFEIIEIADIKKSVKLPTKELQKREMQAIEKQLSARDTIILLDEKGKEFSSQQFSDRIVHYQNQSVQKILFIVGGAYGFSSEFKKKYPTNMALSKMTFTHQMVRLFFVEQLYRAFTIIEGKPYHNQ